MLCGLLLQRSFCRE